MKLQRISKSQFASGAYKSISQLTSTERAKLATELGVRSMTQKKMFRKPKTTRWHQKQQPRQFGTPARKSPEWQYLLGKNRLPYKNAPGETERRAYNRNVDVRLMNTPSSSLMAASQGKTAPAHVDAYGSKRGKRVVSIGQSGAARSPVDRHELLRHELQHALPKRSAARLSQITSSPKKLAREEARADRYTQRPGAISYQSMIDRGERPFAGAEGEYTKLRSKLQQIDGITPMNLRQSARARAEATRSFTRMAGGSTT